MSIMPIAVCLLFIAVGAYMAIKSFIELIKINHCEPVEGTVCERHRHVSHSSKGGRSVSYTPVYSYVYEGELKRWESSVSSREQIGDKTTLYVDYDGKVYSKKASLSSLIVGILMTGAVSVILNLVINDVS